jgi:hypothetical protein
MAVLRLLHENQSYIQAIGIFDSAISIKLFCQSTLFFVSDHGKEIVKCDCVPVEVNGCCIS